MKILITLLSISLTLYANSSHAAQGDDKAKFSENYSDDTISFSFPKGFSVKKLENAYFVFQGEDNYMLNIRGEAEPEDYARQRAEASYKDILADVGTPSQRGDQTETPREVTKVSRYLVHKTPVYIFKSTLDVTVGDSTKTGYISMGFGSFDRYSIWFHHISEKADDDPKALLSFLESVLIK